VDDPEASWPIFVSVNGKKKPLLPKVIPCVKGLIGCQRPAVSNLPKFDAAKAVPSTPTNCAR